MSAETVVFNNTVLRDGHQSLAATRMSTSQMLGALPLLDRLGFGNLETWGGATIDSCLRFLNENPFDRISTLKAGAPNTPHSMLLRGQNIVQYTAFPDDVVRAFVACTAKRGMDIFRVFDALNDTRNVETAVKAVLAAGKHAQGAISYTISPVHTLDSFTACARAFAAMGCQSICIKDMAGLIQPGPAADLVRAIKRATGLPVVLHSHCTAGLAPSSYLAGIGAGVDAVEVSIAPFANGAGQPDASLMLALLEGHPRAPKFDAAALHDLQAHFTRVYSELAAFTSPANERVDIGILRYQVPGGMLSNFHNQLKEQGMAARFREVVDEMPHVRQCLGWIPLVTPTSQIVGTQAMLNVKFGRWKNIAQPTADVVLGKYGRTPGPIDPELLKLAIQKTGEKPVESRPADSLAPRMDSLKSELRSKNLPDNDETAVLYAMFPQQVEAFLKPKPPTPTTATPAPTPAAAPTSRRMTLDIDGHRTEVLVEET